MSEIKDGGPAFGQVVSLRAVRVEMNGDTEWEPESMALGGVTVRDYFAAKAMQGFCANSSHAVLDGEHQFKAAAKEAYLMADAMLRAREA